jgi:hypothetical protein
VNECKPLDAGITALAEYLKTDITITTLNLNSAGIGDEAGAYTRPLFSSM